MQQLQKLGEILQWMCELSKAIQGVNLKSKLGSCEASSLCDKPRLISVNKKTSIRWKQK